MKQLQHHKHTIDSTRYKHRLTGKVKASKLIGKILFIMPYIYTGWKNLELNILGLLEYLLTPKHSLQKTDLLSQK